ARLGVLDRSVAANRSAIPRKVGHEVQAPVLQDEQVGAPGVRPVCGALSDVQLVRDDGLVRRRVPLLVVAYTYSPCVTTSRATMLACGTIAVPTSTGSVALLTSYSPNPSD